MTNIFEKGDRVILVKDSVGDLAKSLIGMKGTIEGLDERHSAPDCDAFSVKLDGRIKSKILYRDELELI